MNVEGLVRFPPNPLLNSSKLGILFRAHSNTGPSQLLNCESLSGLVGAAPRGLLLST